MKKLLILILIVASYQLSGQEKKDFQLQKGDLLFQDLDCGPLCEAIERVTTGYRGAHLSHIGIVDKNDKGQWIVLEAISQKVKITPLEDFLQRSLDENDNPKVLAGRLKPNYQNLVPAALEHTYALLDHPYDNVYDISDSSYYCSELIYFAFKKANQEKPLFKLQPMTFKDPGTGDVFPSWREYYKDMECPVPEGEPGLNPGGISRSRKITIVHYYGKPENFEPKQ